MKKLTCSIAAALALSTFAVAGGDIEPTVAPVEEVMAPAPDVSGFYIGGAYSAASSETDYYRTRGQVDYDNWEEFGSADMDSSGYMLLAGYQYNKYISIEGRYWGSNYEYSEEYTSYYNDQESYDGSWSTNDGEFSAWGIYLKPMYPIGEKFTVYGLLGYGNAEIDTETFGGEKLLDESGFQWGLGASYALSDNISFFVDYVQLASDADGYHDYNAGELQPYYDYNYAEWETSLYTINVGITYKF